MKGWAIGLAVLLVVASLPLMAPEPAHAAFGAPKNISNNAADSFLSPNKGSQIAFSSSHVYAVWEESDANHDVFFVRSTDGGVTFDTPLNLSNDTNPSTNPQVAALGSNVYVVWLSDLGESGEVWFTRSTDNGANFDTPVKLSGSSVLADNPRIAAESTYVYVTWDDPTGGNHDVFVIVGSGNGSTFGTPVNVSSDLNESTQPSIATVGFNVYVAWRSLNGTDTLVFFNKSTDRGVNYDGTMNLGFNNGTTEGPEVAATGSNVHVTWLDNGPGNVDTFHRFSDDSGVSFGSVTNVSDDSGDASGLTIALSGGNAFVAWADDSSGNGDARIALSNNGFVSSWSSNWDITDETASLPRIAAFGSTVYLFWQECVGSVCDILYMKGTHDGELMFFDETVNLSNDGAASFHPHATASTETAFVIWTSTTSPGEIMFAMDPDLVADAGFDVHAIEGGEVFLDGSNSSVPAGEAPIFSWVQTAGPAVTLSNADTATPSFTAPQVDVTTTLTFELTLTSTSGESVDTVDVFVNDMTGILNLSNNSSGSLLPSMVTTGSNVYAVWYDNASENFEIMFSRSTDSGTTFSTPVNLSNDGTDSTIPFVAAVGSDVYVVWEDVTSFFTDREILMRKSTDNGATFGSVVNISNDSALSTVPHMVASGTNVYVTWQSGPFGEADVFFSRSTDNGATFSAPVNISGNLGTSELPVVSASGTDVFLAWSDNTSGNFEILFSRSTDNGANFSSPVNLSNNSGASDWPWVSSTGSDVYVAWMDNTSGNFEILFSRSTDNGANFSSPVNLSNNSGNSIEPFVVSTSDRVVVTWDDESSPPDIFFRESTDNGATFGDSSNISNNSGGSFVPQAAITENSILFIWEDTSAGNHEIFFTKKTSALRAIADELTIASSIAAQKNNPPIADAGPDQTVDEGNLVTLNGSASSDPDDDPLTFSWTQTAGPSVVLSNANIASPTFTAPTITSTANLTFQLIVNDGKTNSAADTVNVLVNDRKGTLTIRKVEQGTSQLLEGAQFTITPNPYTLTGSLLVFDNISDGGVQDADPANGVILLNNVEFGTFTIEETQVPSGFVRIVRTLTATVHSTQTSPIATFENIAVAQPVQQQIPIPPPDLTSTQFNNFVLKGASVNNVAVQTVNDLPQGLLVPPTQLATLPAVSFTETAPPNSTLQNLLSGFTIPTYGTPEPDLAAGNVYIIPPLVINQQDSTNKFVVTPVLEKTQPGMTLLVENLTPTASGSAQLKNVEMTFTNEGSVNNAAFSFSITDTVPPDTPEPPDALLETAALFLTVDFAGDFSGTDFSSTTAFQASPKVRVLVDRDMDVDKLPDGCPDVSLFLFSEATNQWITVKKPARLAVIDTAESCGYEAETDHWSKFAIGGVKITANVIQSIIPGSGRSAIGQSSASTSVGSGSNINTSMSVGGKTIGITFTSVEGSGNVSVRAVSPTQMSGIFSTVSGNIGRFAIASGQGSTPYATFGAMYDIDVSSVTFTGPIEITIPYDPSLLPTTATASDLRLVHYTANGWQDVTLSVDTNARVIRATLNSLSPVATAVIDDGTFPDSYFDSNPLKKMSILSTDIDVSQAAADGSVTLSATIKNAQKVSQDYVVIIQVLDSDGITRYVQTSAGSLARGAENAVSDSVILDGGEYTFMVMVWNSTDASPWPMTEKLESEMRI